MALIEKPLITIAAVSGGGKSSCLSEVCKTNARFKRVLGSTTRDPRPNEANGEDYYFYSRETFLEKVKRGELLEHAEYAGHFYGKEKMVIEAAWENDEIPILDANLTGIRNIRTAYPQTLTFFLTTRSAEQAERRLRKRNGMSEESIQKRLEEGEIEMRDFRQCCDICLSSGDDSVVQVAESMLLFINAYLRGSFRPLPL